MNSVAARKMNSAAERNNTDVPDVENHAATHKRKCDYCRLGYRRVVAKEVGIDMLCLGSVQVKCWYTS